VETVPEDFVFLRHRVRDVTSSPRSSSSSSTSSRRVMRPRDWLAARRALEGALSKETAPPRILHRSRHVSLLQCVMRCVRMGRAPACCI